MEGIFLVRKCLLSEFQKLPQSFLKQYDREWIYIQKFSQRKIHEKGRENKSDSPHQIEKLMHFLHQTDDFLSCPCHNVHHAKNLLQSV